MFARQTLVLAVAALASCSSREATLRRDLERPAAGGSLVEWQSIRSAHLARARNVTIWLPPGYGEDPARRYPVIYAHDGQNLFVAERSFSKVAWRIDRAIASRRVCGLSQLMRPA